MAYISFQPSDFFITNLWTGTGSELAITNVGFQSDSTLIKERNGGNAWNWFDTPRGATNYLKTSGANAEATDAETLKSWQSTGFTVGTSVAENDSGQLYTAFNWKAGTTTGVSGGTITPTAYSINTTSGIGIYKFTGTGSAGTIAHGLGVAPTYLITKNLADGSQYWNVNSFPDLGTTGRLYLNDNQGNSASAAPWNSTAPTSTLIHLGTSGETNDSGNAMIMYAFTPIKGFSAMGGYTGNGNADGPFVFTGFRPALVVTKRTDSIGSWCTYTDKVLGYNPDNDQFLLNDNGAAGVGNNIDLLSNGFKLRVSTAESNAGGGEFIYLAFAEVPIVSSNSKPGVAR